MPGARPSRSRRNTDSVPARTVVSSTLLAHLSIARIRPRVPARRPPLLTAGYRRAGRRFHAVKGRSPRSPKQPGSGCGQARRISRRRPGPVCRSRDSETGAPILPDTGVTSHRRCCRHTRLIRSPTGLVLLRVCDSNGCMPRSARARCHVSPARRPRRAASGLAPIRAGSARTGTDSKSLPLCLREGIPNAVHFLGAGPRALGGGPSLRVWSKARA